MIKIKQARMLLNGRYPDGSKAPFGSNFKFTRYAIVLFAAITMSNFEYHTKKFKIQLLLATTAHTILLSF